MGRRLSPSGFPSLPPPSNDDMEEADPGSDSDFEIDAKKDVSGGFDLGPRPNEQLPV